MKSLILIGGAALALSTSCGGAGGRSATPTTPGVNAAFDHPKGQQTLRKGDTHTAEIDASETQEWGIDLQAGEKLTLDIQATSTGKAMCTNWSWGFWSPEGGTLREQPRGPSDHGTWSDQIEGSAEPSIVEGPRAGRYLVRIIADVACPQLHYTLTAR